MKEGKEERREGGKENREEEGRGKRELTWSSRSIRR